MITNKSLKLKLNTAYFFIYGAWACYFPFLIIYFKDRGLNYIQMGTAFAVLPLVGVICQPVWGYITDKYLNKKITLIIILSCSALSVLFLTFVRSFHLILLSILLLSVFVTSILSIMDALCYEVTSENISIQFGKARLMGSIGFAVLVVIIGIVVKYTNANTPFYIYTLLNLICIAIIITIPDKGRGMGQRMNVGDLADLFKNSNFSIFILSIILINISTGANNSYIGELIKQTGGDVTNLGLVWFIIAFSEVPIFFIGTKMLEKYKDLNLYYLCMIFYSIRFLLDSLCTTWQMVIVVQLMQAITFPIYISATLHYLKRILPPEMMTTGIALYAALGGGLGGFLGNIGGGIVLEVSNVYILYRLIAGLCIIALCAALFIGRKKSPAI